MAADCRFQRIITSNIVWFLDCAHNEMSLDVCAEWFARQSARLEPDNFVRRNLVFGHFSNHRDHAALLNALSYRLLKEGINIQNSLFTPATRATDELPGLLRAISTVEYY